MMEDESFHLEIHGLDAFERFCEIVRGNKKILKDDIEALKKSNNALEAAVEANKI